MTMLEKHIIHKVTVEVFTHSMKTGEYLKENMNAFLEEEVFPFIARYMERYEERFATGSLQFDLVSLKIDVDNITSNQWDKAVFLYHLSKQLDNAFKEVFPFNQPDRILRNPFPQNADQGKHRSTDRFFKEDVKAPNYRWLATSEKSFLSFIFFLEQGELPWWGNPETELRNLDEKLVEKWKELPGFQKKLMNSLSSYQVRQRLFLQYTPTEIIRLISYLPIRFFKSREVVNSVAAYLRKVSFWEERVMTWVLVELAVNGKNQKPIFGLDNPDAIGLFRPTIRDKAAEKSLDDFVILLRRFIAEKYEKTFDSLIHRIKRSIKPSEYPKRHSAYLNSENENTGNQPTISQDSFFTKAAETPVEGKLLANMGIILLHPFLGAFFTDCGVLDRDKRFSDPSLAVQLLHYAATGEKEAPDFELQFEKILIGLPVEQPLDRFVIVSQRHKDQVGQLLDSLLENWPKLKNTSVDTVRVEFLQRSGKIQQEGNVLRIIMDRKVQDILLDGLPFNLGMVKLSWREEFIFVDW